MIQSRSRRAALLVRAALVAAIAGSALALSPVPVQARPAAPAPSVTPVEVRAPSLPLTPFVPLVGDLPSTTVDSGGVPLGAVRTLAAAGSWAVPGTSVPAEGQALSPSTYPNAASVLGTAFGGDGTTTFGVPDLRGRTVNGVGAGPGLSPVARGEQIGSSQATVTRANLPVSYGGSGTAFVRRQPALGLTYLIRTSGRDASYSAIGFDAMGVVIPYAGTVIPAGWMAAEGQLLTIADHAALHAVLGTTYGGDGATTFALPDLRGRTAVGTGCGLGMPSCRTLGQVFGSEAVTLTTAELPTAIGGGGQPGSNDAPSLALNQLCVQYGIFPSSSGTAIDPVVPFVSEVILYAGRFPTDYEPQCAGQQMSIAQNSAYFALIGTTYGGDGQNTFGLPDLRGRSAIGQGSGIYVGLWYGWSSFYLTTANLPAPEVPTAPTIGTAVRGDEEATVTWTAPVSNGGSPVTGYRVTPHIGGVAQTAVVYGGDTATSQTVTGLTNGTAYQFTVAAINAVGTGAGSGLSAPTTPGVPGAPTMGSGVRGDGVVTLSWTAGSAGASSITGYVVYRWVGGVPQPPATVFSGDTATTQTITGLTNGVTYVFRVAAINEFGTGSKSGPRTVTPAAVPGAPTGVSGVRGNARVTLSWTAPVSTGGSAITGYTVTPYISGVAQTPVVFTGSGTQRVLTGLVNGTEYTFTVAARNLLGTGAASDPSGPVTPATVPGAPTIGTAVPGDGQVTLSWTAPGSTGGSPITGYVVYRWVGGVPQAPATVFSGDTATTQTITGLSNGVTYVFRVAAINAVGTGTKSGPSNSVTPALLS